jgi:hypothetical protein
MAYKETDYKFARMSGQTYLRPDYANAITHFRSESTGYSSLVGAVLVCLALVVLGIAFAQ